MPMELTAKTTLADILLRSYDDYAERPALRDHKEAFTYRELKQRALRIGAHLRQRGVKRGDRVLLIMNNCSEYVQLEHALILAGFVRICAITRLHASEVVQLVADAGPTHAFIEAAWLQDAGADFLQRMPCPVVTVGNRTMLDSSMSTGLEDFAAFTTPAEGEQVYEPPQPDELMWFMYTSGSTGAPKGVMHTQYSISAMILNALRAMPLARPEDVALHTAPLSHFSGVIAHVVSAAGGENVALDRFDPAMLFDAVAEHRATVLPVVPTQLNMLTDYLNANPRDTSGIRIVPYAGSAIAPERLAAAKRFFDGALLQYYGSSEIPLPLTVLAAEDHIDTRNEQGMPRFASAGRAFPGVDIKILDLDNTPLPPGSTGEILARGPTVSKGYWGNPAASQEIQENDGFIRTGDVGMFDNDGFLFIVDRRKDMIVTGGFNVYPREVENAISAMPGVTEVAVVSAPDEKWGEAIVAVITPAPGVAITLEQVQAHCRQCLAGYKQPRRLLLVDALPKGSTGKVQKRLLSQQFWGDRQRKVGG